MKIKILSIICLLNMPLLGTASGGMVSSGIYSINNVPVITTEDTTAPTVIDASINGTAVEIFFSEVVTGYSDTLFNIDATSTGNDISLIYDSGSGTTSHDYIAASAVSSGEAVVLNFDGGVGVIHDSADNDLVAFSNVSVTNNTPGELVACPEDAIIINSLPYSCNVAGEDYALGTDLIINSGAGITISKDNVSICGNGKKISYANTGAGIAINISTTITAVEIRDIIFDQGDYNGTTYNYAIKGTGYGYKVHGNTFNLVAGGDGGGGNSYGTDSYGLYSTNGGSGNSLYNNTFNLSGEDRLNAFKATGVWDIYENTVSFTNHTMPNDGRYPYVFYLTGYSNTVHDNDITIASNTRAVNVFAAWSPAADGHKIYDNTINFAGDHGRLFLMDSGTDNWQIYGNDITVTSQNGYNNSVAVFRARSSNTGDAASTGHIIHSNSVDTTGADAKTSIVSLGDNSPDTADIKIYNNIFSGYGNIIELYSNSGSVSNLDVYSNVIEHTGITSGYAVYSNDPAYTDIVFSHNVMSTTRSDGNLLYTQYDNSSNISFCQSDITSGDIAGGGSAYITESTCQDSWLGTPIQSL